MKPAWKIAKGLNLFVVPMPNIPPCLPLPGDPQSKQFIFINACYAHADVKITAEGSEKFQSDNYDDGTLTKYPVFAYVSNGNVHARFKIKKNCLCTAKLMKVAMAS